MPEYLPLGAFRQGLLPSECRACIWWQSNGRTSETDEAAAQKRHEWVSELEHDWGCVGLLVHEPGGRRTRRRGHEVTISASIQFAPASSLPRFRELPFPPLPSLSALLFCLHVEGDSSRSMGKRVIRKALYELRNRGVREVCAVTHCAGKRGHASDCRFLPAEFLAATGFEEVSRSGDLCLMRVDNRGLLPLKDQVQSALRQLIDKEPAPSPAVLTHAWGGAQQEVP